MTLKTRFLTFSAVLTLVFSVLLDYTIVYTARKAMLERVEDRAGYIASFVDEMISDKLEAGGGPGVEINLEGLTSFRNISYLKISDSGGKVIYRMSRPGLRVGDKPPDADVFSSTDNIYDISREIIRNDKQLGVIQLGLSIEGIRESLETIMWRAITISIAFLLLIPGAIWLLTRNLGRQLDALLALSAGMHLETLPASPQPDLRTETGKIAFALRETHTRLRAEEKLRVEAETQKDDFFAMTVHDLKQPLTSLKAALDLLFSEEDVKNFSKEQVRSLAAVAGTSLRMLNSMVVDVLNTAKIKSRDYAPEKERISLAGFMRECAEENSASVKAANKKWLFSLPGDIGDAWIFGDHDMLKRVIGNLVLNAIQYTPEGGAVKLGVRLPSEDKAAVYVSDEGEGIPDSFREEIFKKYQGLGKSSKNIGLGLAFCKMVADTHAARIDARSEMGKGTEVSFVIPVSRPAGAKAR